MKVHWGYEGPRNEAFLSLRSRRVPRTTDDPPLPFVKNEETAREITENCWSTKKVRKGISSNSFMLPKITKMEGKDNDNRWGIIETATKFYENLYSDNRPNTKNRIKSWEQVATNAEDIISILHGEVFKVLKNTKADKTPEPDKIENKTLISLADSIVAPLTSLFNKIIQEGATPTQWYTSQIILIHKKGQRTNINNYRPISLTSNIGKLFIKILKERIYKTLDEQQPIEQAGFRKRLSTVDHIHTINQLLEKAREYNFEVKLAFVDFNKAFDTIYHDKIW